MDGRGAVRLAKDIRILAWRSFFLEHIMRHHLQSLYDWTMALAAKPYALVALFLVAFAESSVFPIPPDVLIIPMVLAARDKAWTVALVATVASVLGGLLGYAIGFYFYDGIGEPILQTYGYLEKFESFAARYNEYGAWIVVLLWSTDPRLYRKAPGQTDALVLRALDWRLHRDQIPVLEKRHVHTS